MEKFRKILKKTMAGIIMAVILLNLSLPVNVSLASDFSLTQEIEGENGVDDPDEDLVDKDLPVLGSGSYGKELNRQGYKVQVTSYVGGTEAATFKEGILRYKDQYVFCYNPGKSFKETDNVTLHNEVPAELTEEQGKTIALMIYYIFNNYNVLGEEGAINYYLGQCVIWNYINYINPSFNPYRIYITDSASSYTKEQQEEALNTILSWVEENKNDYDTYIQYWTNNDGDYQPVLYGWAYPIEKKGNIEVQKYSTDTLLTSGNNNYSFEGAIYGVYSSEAEAFLDSNRITIITTGQDGKGTSGELSYGTYYVKELVSPPGFELDGNIYNVTISSLIKSPVVSSAEKPVPGKIRLNKVSENESITDNNENYNLIGAVYGVYGSFDDAENHRNAVDTITTQEDGIGESRDLPFGRYYVREISPSKGFEIDEKIYTADINATVKLCEITSKESIKFGNIKVVKSSANEIISNDNDNYSLKGAIYGIYNTLEDAEGDINRISSVSTDEYGIGISENLPIGTYYVKEVMASKGFSLDLNVYTAKIDEDIQSVTVSSSEKPQNDPVPLVVIKKDDESDDNYETLYLSNAVFEIKFYAAETENEISDITYKRHWYLKTGTDGRAYLNNDYITTFDGISGDEFYYDEFNEPTIPLGYITVQEVKAPYGYVLNDTIDTRKVIPEMTELQRENECIVKNREIKQSFQLVKLAEDGTSDFKPLANAGFMACKVCDLSLDKDGNYIFDEKKAVELTVDGSRELFTNEDGYAISAELRYGTYLVHETTVPIGYMPVADFLITVSEDSRTSQKLIYKTDMQKKYYLRVTKVDSTTNRPVLNNSATYKIWSYKENDFISFRTYTGSGYEKVSEFKTDENGVLITPEAITYGNYRLVEDTAPIGYNIDNPSGIDFSIDDNTIYITTENLGDTVSIVDIVYSDTPVTGELSLGKKGEIRKYDEEKNEFVTETIPLENIEFGVYADEDICTLDGSKTIIYEKGELVYKIITDKEGKSVQKDIPLGKYVVKELNTPDDFIKSEDIKIDINIDNKKLNADGVYYVEQPVELLNKAYYPKVKTTALDNNTNEHIGKAGLNSTIVDKVYCSDLVIGRTYLVKGKLYDTSIGDAYKDDNGDEVTACTVFTANEVNQTVRLEFTFDGENLAGKTVTVFENLYYDGKIVAAHTDISDIDQQVRYPDIKTTALDGDTKIHTGVVGESVKVVDSVACSNLFVGKEYTISGKLYNVETGEAILEEGKEITAKKIFTAEEENPVIELEFTLNSEMLKGESVVCFEDLYINDIKVASHADLEDKNQQVHYPKIETTAKNAVDGGKIASPDEKITLNDTVDISNIDVGENLVIKGVIYDKSTGEKLLVKGSEVWAYSEFTSVDKNMKTDVVFTFDASELAGKSVVLYEYMYISGEEGNEVLVASHEDINYEGQTIIFSEEPQTGDKDLTWIIITMIISALGITMLTLRSKISK